MRLDVQNALTLIAYAIGRNLTAQPFDEALRRLWHLG